MIKVKRLSCPDVLKISENPISDGEYETSDSIMFFNNTANHTLSYVKTNRAGKTTKESFTVYKDKSIRKQLIKMFNGKCGYCESKIISIYNGDIEHFRPKGGYGNANPITQPGYYWLASDWDNLLFACPFCNQTNTHEISESGAIKEIVLGKLNQFPLVTEKYRLNYRHGQIFLSNNVSYNAHYALEESERLLLKPCTDDVERYFHYDDSGVISASNTLTSFEEEQAKTSIHVYALQRIDLVRSREQKIIQIKAQLKRIEEALYNFSEHYDSVDEEKTWFEGILTKELKILEEYKEPHQEYAGLARYIIDEYFDALTSV